MRAYAYLHACRWGQAAKDARVAIAFGPQQGGTSCWPRALAALSSAIESSQARHAPTFSGPLCMQLAILLIVLGILDEIQRCLDMYASSGRVLPSAYCCRPPQECQL